MMVDALRALMSALMSALMIYMSWRYYRHRQQAIPGPLDLPMIGSLLSLMRAREWIGAQRRAYGPTFMARIGRRTTVFIGEPGDIRATLMGEEDIVRQDPMQHVKDLGSGSLFALHGPAHLAAKTIIMKCMTGGHLYSLVGIVQPIIHDVTGEWASRDPQQCLHQTIRSLVFRLSQTILLGEYDADLGAILDPLYHTYQNGFVALPINLPFTAVGKAYVARSAIFALLEKDIDTRCSTGNFGGGIVGVLLQAILDDPDSPMRVDEIAAHALILLLGAYDTTTATLEIFLDTLARHPDVVEDLFEEQRHLPAILDFKSISESRLPLLDAALQESMRLHPAVTIGFFRTVLKSFQASSGATIRAGWSISPAFKSACADDIVDGDAFRPRRYLVDSADCNRPKFQHVPFGAGRHGCPGVHIAQMLIKVAVLDIIRQYRWMPTYPGQPTHWIDQSFPTPVGPCGLALSFTPRDPS